MSSTLETPTTWTGRAKRLAPAMVPLVLVVVVFGAHLVGARSLSSADQLYNWEPWRTERPADLTQTHGAPFSDNYDHHFPARREFSDRVWAGDWPLWSQLSGGGVDLGLNIQAAAAAPSAAVSVLASGWYAPGLLKALELVGAWTFVFLFMRRLGTGRIPASFAGLVFSLSGFQVVWVNWPHTRVAMFAAGLLWALDRVVERPSPDRIAVGAIITAALVLEGFPAVAAVGIGAAALVLAVRVVQLSASARDAGVRVAAAAGSLLLGIGATAAITVPFAARLQTLGLQRGVPDDASIARGLGTVLTANALGPAERYFGPHNYIEIVGYLGIAAALCIAVGLAVVAVGGRPGPKDVLLIITSTVGGVMLLYSYAVEPFYDLFRWMPVLSTSSPTRVKASALMLLAIAAGLALDRMREPGASPRTRAIATGTVFTSLAICIAYLWGFARDAHPELTDYVRGEIARTSLVGLAVAAAITVIVNARRVRTRDVAALAILAVAAVDAVAWVLPYYPRSEPEEFYPITEAHAYLGEHLGPDRFASLGPTFYSGTSAFYGHRSVGGHNYFAPTWLDGLVAAGMTRHSQTSGTFQDPTSASSPILDRMGVTLWADAAGTARCDDGPAPGATETLGAGQLLTEGPGVRAVSVTPAGDLAPGTELVASVRLADDSTLAGRRRLVTGAPAGTPVLLAVPHLEEASGPLRISVAHADGSPVEAGSPVPCRAPDDGLRLVHASGAWIYGRSGALPRIRAATTAIAVPDEEERLELLAAGTLDDDVVVLSDQEVATPPVTSDPSLATGPGDASVVESSGAGDTISAVVDAPSGGWLVLADSLQDGWVAEVDGERSQVVAADHWGVAVRVAPGRSTVELSYRPRGLGIGMILSIASAAGVLALLGWAAVRARARPAATSEIHHE